MSNTVYRLAALAGLTPVLLILVLLTLGARPVLAQKQATAAPATSAAQAGPAARGKQSPTATRPPATRTTAKAPTRGPGKGSASMTHVPAQARPALKRPTGPIVDLDEPAPGATEVSLTAQALRSGCLPPGQDIQTLLRSVNIDDPLLTEHISQHRADLLQSQHPECIAFTLSIGDASQVTSMALLKRDPQDPGPQLISLTRRAGNEGFDLQVDRLPHTLIDHRKVDVALEQILSDRGRSLAGALPVSLERQVHALARAFQERHELKPGSLVRIVYTEDSADGSSAAPGQGKARLLGMRFFDAKQVLDFGSAVWIDRDDLPGGFFTTAGVDAERMFWSSPIDHSRISRGVGSFAYSRSVRQTVRKGDSQVRVIRRVSGWTHHQGVDFAAPTGTPVHAVADGQVLMAAFYGGYGNLIILEHAGGYTTYYAHLSAYAGGLRAGSVVRRGDEIGRVGSTGRSTGPHLHFEIRKDNVYLDPLAQGRNLDLWALRERDQHALARRNLLLSAITGPAGAPSPTQSATGPSAPAEAAVPDGTPLEGPTGFQADTALASPRVD